MPRWVKFLLMGLGTVIMAGTMWKTHPRLHELAEKPVQPAV